jgi:hypothetical protein
MNPICLEWPTSRQKSEIMDWTKLEVSPARKTSYDTRFTCVGGLTRESAPRQPTMWQLRLKPDIDDPLYGMLYNLDYDSSGYVSDAVNVLLRCYSYNVTGQAESTEALEQEFNKRADRWEKESGIHSAPSAKYLHRDYQYIISRGEKVIPLILNRLETSKKDWFWALRTISGEAEDPAGNSRNFGEAVEAWKNWARRKNLLS